MYPPCPLRQRPLESAAWEQTGSVGCREGQLPKAPPEEPPDSSHVREWEENASQMETWPHSPSLWGTSWSAAPFSPPAATWEGRRICISISFTHLYFWIFVFVVSVILWPFSSICGAMVIAFSQLGSGFFLPNFFCRLITQMCWNHIILLLSSTVPCSCFYKAYLCISVWQMNKSSLWLLRENTEMKPPFCADWLLMFTTSWLKTKAENQSNFCFDLITWSFLQIKLYN